jgi:TetR/AcrR family transcriptional regulator, transcriptional repressor of bet genes
MPGKQEPEDVRREQILQAAFEVASRSGIGGLTVRAVAAEAALSHGLVLYHFRRKERLVYELLEWLIGTTSVLHVSEDVARLPDPLDRFHALLEQEMTRLSRQPRHTRLFFEYWALGVRNEPIRERIGAELKRYRAAFREIVEELLREEPANFRGLSAEALAAVSVSWIHGCAVQALVAPAQFDSGEYFRAVRAMVSQLA